MTVVGTPETALAHTLARPGPARDIWAEAAVRERFRVGELLDFVATRSDNDAVGVEAARYAAVDLDDVAESATGADGRPAQRLGKRLRETVLAAIGADDVRLRLDRIPAGDRTDADSALLNLVSGETPAPNNQDRDRLLTLAEALPLARAAGVIVSLDRQALTQAVDDLDFLSLVGGEDLHRFVGRAAELKRMGKAWSERQRPVFIEGIGGIGKSFLLARFVSDLLAAPDRPDAVFHLDFDRRDLQSATPAQLFEECLRQSARWTSGRYARALATDAARGLSRKTTQLQGSSRSLESFGALDELGADMLVDAFRADNFGSPRFVIIADSAERVFGFDDIAAESPLEITEQLRGRGVDVLLIYAARCFPESWKARPAVRISLQALQASEALSYLRAETAREEISATNALLTRVYRLVGRTPLALRMAVRLLAEGDADLRSWPERAARDPERIQAMLYDRILMRLRNPDLRKLARPGLLLRRLTPDLIEAVLAEPCGLDLAETPAKRLLELARGEGQMFTRDLSDPDPLAVWHRQDVRAVMLRDLDRVISPEVAETINCAAVNWYMQFVDVFSRTEELYHRLRLDQTPPEIGERWIEEAGERLRSALEDFPERAAKYARSRLQSATRSEIGYASAPGGGGAPDVNELRQVVQREIQRGEAPLATLVRYNADSVDSEVGDAYANALVLSGRLDQLLAETRALRSRPGAGGPEVRAAVFAVAAGVLEGQAKLDEALIYWLEADGGGHRRRGNIEAELTSFSARIGALRTRRKLRLSQGRRPKTILELAEEGEHLSSEILRRPVLLREAVAEFGKVLTVDDHRSPIFRRWLEVLLDGIEAFPSALVEPGRLTLIARRLGAPSDVAAARLGPLATKLIWERRAPVIIEILREEVDWSLRRAVSRPVVSDGDR